jgi:hypothetical protein
MNSLQDAIRDGKKITELPLLYLLYFFSISRSIPSTLSGVLGALDGIAVKVNKPSGENIQRSYWCLKGYYAIPIQAIVDSDYKFTYMSAIAVGSTYDSLAFLCVAWASSLKRRPCRLGFRLQLILPMSAAPASFAIGLRCYVTTVKMETLGMRSMSITVLCEFMQNNYSVYWYHGSASFETVAIQHQPSAQGSDCLHANSELLYRTWRKLNEPALLYRRERTS